MPSPGTCLRALRVKIRSATSHDLPFVAGLAEATAKLPHWSPHDLGKLVDPDTGLPLLRLLLIAEDGSTPIGFAIASILRGAPPVEAEIETIAVRGSSRRGGAARALLHALFEQMNHARVETVRLEVRRSNAAAIALYRSSGFVDAGTRSRYYADPVEDALLMQRTCQSRGLPASAVPVS